ncbi:MAG: serine/threonine-protein kinase PknK, partial [Candidatus Hydrothermarchaeaceae archaeon]
EYPTPEELDLFEYGYRITKELDLPGVVRVYSLENVGHSKAMVMEGFDAIPLNKYLSIYGEDLVLFLQVAVSIAEIIGDVHEHNIIHKGIQPQNILINPETKQVKITDFCNATRVQREVQTIAAGEMIRGSLSYISPEQTGRMNRSVDYRTDFYSLGVTLYEMLTGRLPFVSEDPMELVHAHIARMPVRPDELKEGIPEVISEIVMKLLSKTAEERYQSAGGLKADLKECHRRLQETGRVEKFRIGEQDTPERFQIPEKLYGREEEVKVLFDEFEEAAGGKTRIIFVSGPPGIGKSFLIQEIHKPLVEHGGYFISGKFERYKRNIPYTAIIQAFGGLIKRLLMESQERLDGWKSSILGALGPNGQVIVDVIPELELVIGKQQPVQPLGPVESRNRFNLTFQSFIRVLPRPENPLVVFIDDWQWADFGTLALLKTLAEDAELKHLLFIGAFRDNEVDASHPFIITLKEIEEEQQIKINQLALRRLALNHINGLVSGTLHRPEKGARPLARLIEEKTGGNPFFVKQFMQSLYQDRLLRFDTESLSWKWDMAAIKEKRVTDNVVDLMVKRLKSLPEGTQEVLRLASCMGNRFDLKTLSIIHERKQTETLDHLWRAIAEEYILPQDENYKLVSALKEKEVGVESRFKFLHDRVQQASYSLIPIEERKAVHLRIGRLLLENTKEEELEEKVFDIAGQLNRSIELITEEPERLRLAGLNLTAGRKAKASTAFNSALSYFTKGTEALKEAAWRTHYEMMFDLHRERAEAEYLNGNFEKSEELINQLLEKAKTDIERAEIYGLLILQNITIARYKEAIQAGRKALALLGVELPQKDLDKAFRAELDEVKKNLGGREISSLAYAPEMTVPEKRVAAKLQFYLGPLLYFSNYKLWRINYLNAVDLTLKYGVVPESTATYTGYGMLLCFELQEYKTAYEFGLLGLKISERFNSIYHK